MGSVANGRIGLQAVAVVIRGSSRRSGRARRKIQKHVSHNYRGATGFQLLMHRQERQDTNNRKYLPPYWPLVWHQLRCPVNLKNDVSLSPILAHTLCVASWLQPVGERSGQGIGQ